MKGVTTTPRISTASGQNFNPHTREGCDEQPRDEGRDDGISIHTPVKGVTLPLHSYPHTTTISIHTPVKGVTRSWQSTSGKKRNFNPHTREGCDVRPGRRSLASCRHFNPHTREGCDLFSVHTCSAYFHFNPHTREGCDETDAAPHDLGIGISIHTPVKGVTTYRGSGRSPVSFQSTHP